MTSSIKVERLALNRTIDDSFRLIVKKTEYVETDAGGWVDALMGIYKISLQIAPMFSVKQGVRSSAKSGVEVLWGF